MWKKGQLRRNWKERWFTLRPSNLFYYTGEDRKDCQGNIVLDENCCVEVEKRASYVKPPKLSHILRQIGADK